MQYAEKINAKPTPAALANYRSDNPRRVPLPVSFSKQPLVELAVLAPGKFGQEIDRLRTFDVAEPVPAVGDQVVRELRGRERRAVDLHHRFDLLSEFRVRDADDRDIRHER